MSSTTSNIHLVCFVRGETGKDIFPVVIDNNSTVENLGVEIRKVRQDLSQKNFDLYVRKFKQPNHGLVNTVNTTEKKQGELMEPPNKFTYYFSVEDIKGLKKNPPYLQYDGEIGLSYTSRKCWKKIPRILGSSESESKLRYSRAKRLNGQSLCIIGRLPATITRGESLSHVNVRLLVRL
ncbi:hypothetical protein RhiirC2_761930 [Rhizophagus irregularis]|uniref:Crinkler effector protein N-terminal domain-containing protein n=1 Tax=Rhizophagus irregularis TaxID=588596 RepID=A0A2N1MF74_9GLOM|nr:hypothetical protein RhiirC2_761930 [Rhizophagus irregularis]